MSCRAIPNFARHNDGRYQWVATRIHSPEKRDHFPHTNHFCTAKDSEDDMIKALIRVPTIISPNHIPYATYWQE